MAAAVQITSASPPPDKELTKEVCTSWDWVHYLMST